jgi:hypothetical protein
MTFQTGGELCRISLRENFSFVQQDDVIASFGLIHIGSTK